MSVAAVSVALHALAAVVWVGGMAFAYAFLRPAAGETLAGPERLRLWRGVFRRFFPVVWAAVALLLVTGYHLLFGAFGGFSGAGVHVHIMHAVALVMIAIFGCVYFMPWPRLSRAVDTGDGAAGAAALAMIRRLIALNLGLGLIVVVVGASGRWW